MSKYWIKCALIRAVKTIAQTAIAMIGTSVVIAEVDWVVVVSASLLSGLLSILTSIAGLPEVELLEESDEEEIEEEIEEEYESEVDPSDDEELPQ